jgi:hypothetical protein
MHPTKQRLTPEVVLQHTGPSLSIAALRSGEHLQHCLQPILGLKWIGCMGEHLGVMAHELTMLVEWHRLVHMWIVYLSLQVGHSVGQVLKELSLGLEKLLHDRIHLS